MMQRLIDSLEQSVGSKKDFAPKIGCAVRTVRSWFNGERKMSLPRAWEILEVLEYEPRSWMVQALRLDFGSILAIDTPCTCNFVLKELRPAARALPHTDKTRVILVPNADTPKIAKLEDFPTLSPERPEEALALIESLDLLLQTSPAGVRDKAIELIQLSLEASHGNTHLYCATVGIFASANRALGQPSTALHALRLTLPLAILLNDPILLARLYRRLAWVLYDRLQLPDAIKLAKEACSLYLDADAYSFMPFALVDLGAFLRHHGQPAPAIQVLNQALASLPASATDYRASAHIQLSTAHAAQGALDQATEQLDLAELLVEPSLHSARAALMCQRGEIMEARGNLPDAAVAFNEATKFLKKLNPLHFAVVQVHLISLLYRLDDAARIQDLARHLVFALQPIVSEVEGVTEILESALALTTEKPSAQKVAQLGRVTRAVAPPHAAIGRSE